MTPTLTTLEQAELFPGDLPDHDGQITRYERAGLAPTTARLLESRAARIISLGRRAILEIGAELVSARQEAAYGTWGTFLTRCGIEERTAQNYMRVIETFRDKPEIISALPSTALYALAAPNADPVAVAQVVEEVKAGARPSAQEVKARVAPTPPVRPATQPARPAPAEPESDEDEDEIASAPVARPLPPSLPASLPASLPPALTPLASVDMNNLKLLAAKYSLLRQALTLVEEEIRTLPESAPVVTIPGDRALAAARQFVSGPGLGGAAAMLAFSALVEEAA